VQPGRYAGLAIGPLRNIAALIEASTCARTGCRRETMHCDTKGGADVRPDFNWNRIAVGGMGYR
jgi:hypothetical protein